MNQFVAHVFLRVRATNELLIPGLPYILSMYQDSMTGINYVKLYRYQNSHDGVHPVVYVDATCPVRSYEFSELNLVTLTQDDMGYEIFKEEALIDVSQIVVANKTTVWSYKFVNSVASTK